MEERCPRQYSASSFSSAIIEWTYLPDFYDTVNAMHNMEATVNVVPEPSTRIPLLQIGLPLLC